MLVQFGHATPHKAKCTIDYLRANRLRQAPHPAFSLNLTPSDFYIFGKLKMALIGAAFAEDGELLHGVMEVPNGISREELEEVFEERLRRSERCIHQNGEYVE
jgi:hypothetical protein